MWDKIISAGSSLLGGLLGRDAQKDAAEKQAQLQKQFAKQGIQWKVADAKKAGVHPLYALGASTHSYTPMSVGGDPLASGIAEAGNAISQGVHRTMTAGERVGGRVLQELAIERAKLENDRIRVDLLASQNQLLNQAGRAVAMPTTSDSGVSPDMLRSNLFENDPRVAMVKPPSAEVDAIKLFGYPLIRNPRLFSSADKTQGEYGEGGEWMAGIPAMLEAWSQAILRDNLRQLEVGRRKFGRR